MGSGEGSTTRNFSLYCSSNIVRVIKSRRLRWAGHVARMEEGRRLRWAGHIARMEHGRSAFKTLAGKPAEKRSLGKPRLTWENGIRMNKEINIDTRNLVDSVQECE